MLYIFCNKALPLHVRTNPKFFSQERWGVWGSTEGTRRAAKHVHSLCLWSVVLWPVFSSADRGKTGLNIFTPLHVSHWNELAVWLLHYNWCEGEMYKRHQQSTQSLTDSFWSLKWGFVNCGCQLWIFKSVQLNFTVIVPVYNKAQSWYFKIERPPNNFKF